MELKQDEIIKALECCTSPDRNCDCGYECPYGDLIFCTQSLMAHTLALIKELTEENEKQLNIIVELSAESVNFLIDINNLKKENERLRVVADMSDTTLTDALRIVNEFCDSRIKRARADTVREMQERIKAEKFHHKNFGDLVYLTDIDRIADELIKKINKGEIKNEEDSDTI